MYLELEWNISSGCLKAAFLFSTDNNGTVEHFSPDEHVKKVDEGKLDESSEDGHEAHDDKDVKGSSICNLHCGFEDIFSAVVLNFCHANFKNMTVLASSVHKICFFSEMERTC